MFDQYAYSIRVNLPEGKPKVQKVGEKAATDNADLSDESLDLDTGSA